MRKKRFSVEQMIGVLKQAQVGVPVADVIRKAGISEQTLYPLSMEGEVRRPGSGPGPPDGSVARRERAAEAACGGADAEHTYPRIGSTLGSVGYSGSRHLDGTAKRGPVFKSIPCNNTIRTVSLQLLYGVFGLPLSMARSATVRTRC
jgi:hypothetical protein